MSFTRVVEDFVCEHCGAHVSGTGFTNHCPRCLWSKHVDNDPGDRAATCGGMMQPVAVEGATPEYRLVHRCQKCGTTRRVKVSSDDDMTLVVALAEKRSLRA